STPQAEKPAPPANGHTKNGSNGSANGHPERSLPAAAVSAAVIDEISTKLLERAGAAPAVDSGSHTTQAEQFAGFQVDAPACDSCGAITVRNGNCYLCHTCGDSMGCS
ncbi:MAG: vitamin B12-dependent ribonucleotide reductase, partial [Planctomycetota bacterium]